MRGVEDVDGVVGADDFNVAAGVKDFGRLHGSGRGALRRWRPWSKIAVLVFDRGEILSRDGGWSRRSREDMRMTAVKTVPRAVFQSDSRAIEDDGKAKRKLAPGCPIFTEGLFFSAFVGNCVSYIAVELIKAIAGKCLRSTAYQDEERAAFRPVYLDVPARGRGAG